MRRRDFLTATGTGLALSTAGCLGLFETETVQTDNSPPPLVEDRPDAVYVPTHVEGMEMVDTAESGRYRFALTYSFPHRFWLVTGDRRRQVEIRDEDSVHLMLVAWDSETQTVIPASNPTVTVTRDGSEVASKSLWSMLSQNMGVHFGDNVALDGDGTYEVAVDFGPVQTRRVGGLAGTLADQASLSFSMEFSQETLDSVPYERLEDRQGERDAADPMGMEMIPSGQVPPASELPGDLVGEATSGDATFAVTALSEVPRGIDAEGTYLAVSARTPYNRYPLPFLSLSATLARGEETIFDGSLSETLHPGMGYHYSTVVDSVQSGDSLDIAVDAVPQIARHEGYETAFIEMDGMSMTV